MRVRSYVVFFFIGLLGIENPFGLSLPVTTHCVCAIYNRSINLKCHGNYLTQQASNVEVCQARTLPAATQSLSSGNHFLLKPLQQKVIPTICCSPLRNRLSM